MPLPTDEKLLALSNDLLAQFDAIFGLHPGFRPAHAKGVLLSGEFQPTARAAGLSRAPHFNQPSTPVLVRFSNSTGLPLIPDNNPNADPRGMAVRFVLGEHKHTDIIGHSTRAFPARTGQEFLEFLRAAAVSDPLKLEGSPLEAFFQSHPAALYFAKLPKPAPSSYARESYFGLTAIRFLNNANEAHYGRYRLVPEEGNDFVDDATLKERTPNYLREEITERLQTAPARFKVMAEIAAEGDEVNDVTVHWPEDRELAELGTINITSPVPDDAAEQKQIIFDPIPRVDGIEPSDDPLLELRAAVYLLSGRRRRAAPLTPPQ
jgi:catalase